MTGPDADPWPPPSSVAHCRSADDASAPCRFATCCPEARQLLQAGLARTDTGFLMQIREPLQGDACFAYQHLTDLEARETRAPDPEQVTRDALKAGA